MNRKKNKFKTTYDKVSLKLVINFLFDNCFLNLVICHFNKIVGINMGSDPVHFMSNLVL